MTHVLVTLTKVLGHEPELRSKSPRYDILAEAEAIPFKCMIET